MMCQFLYYSKNTGGIILGEKFNHLTLRQRSAIEGLFKEGHTQAQIARNIGVSRTTISNEIKRGAYIKRDSKTWKDVNAYSADLAEDKYRQVLREKGKEPKIGSDWGFLKHIEKMIIENKYSPQAILTNIKKEGLQFKTTICLSTLYNCIRKGMFLNVCLASLPQPQKVKKKKRKHVQHKPSRGTSIEKRPAIVETRKEFGHWEMDTVVGGKKSKKSLLVFTERKTRKEIIEILKNHTAAEVVRALGRIERRLGEKDFRNIFKSITVDNGTEFSDCEGMESSRRNKKKRTNLFYCHAYSFFERGSNENQNKLIRRWIPKGLIFDDKTITEIKEIEHWINNYPRPMFGGCSSDDLYEAELLKLMA